jgi:hypothetical protein
VCTGIRRIGQCVTGDTLCDCVPHTRVLLWVAGESLWAAFENVTVAEYRCRYDWQDRKVKDIHGGVFYPTRFASPQGTLIPLTPQESLVVY